MSAGYRRLAVWSLVAAVMVTVVGVAPADAAPPSASCLAAALPTTPGAPDYSVNLFRSDSSASLVLWREACADGTGPRVLVRISPLENDPFICYADFTLLQDEVEFVHLDLENQDGSSLCAHLFVPTTLKLVPLSGSAWYDTNAAFALLYQGDRESLAARLQVPAPPPPASVAVVGTGCAPTCHSNQVVGYTMVLTNDEPPFTAEIKGGVRLPDGTILPFVNTVTTIPSGASTMPLVPSQALPANLPAVDVIVEAAILEPNLGVTVSRSSATLHLLP